LRISAKYKILRSAIIQILTVGDLPSPAQTGG
jgi:hypothetical protein